MNNNILLINPKINECSQNKKINSVINIAFPTSLGFLASYLTASGLENIEITDEQINPISDEYLPQLINSLEKPRIIGISVLTLNSSRAYELADKIKVIDPESTVILGGIHPTVLPEEALSVKSVDVIIRGEGEETLTELVHLILKGEDYKHIAGISYIKDGVIVHNTDRPLIEDLDKIPPFPYYMFEKNIDKYPNFSSVFSSRGCPYSCSFCSSRSVSGKKYRYNSIERIIEDCKNLVYKYKQNSIFFMDDNIAVNKNQFIALCDAIIKEGLHEKVFFHASMRGDNASEEILKKAKEANFKIVYYGLETACESLMKQINKGETVQEVVDAIKRADKAGLAVGTTIIFGLPTETRKDRWDAIRLVNSLPLISVRFNTLAPYPGTPVYNMLAPEGKILIKKDWVNFGVQYMWESDDIPYVPEENDRLELIFDTMFANLSYYLSISGIKKLIKSPVAGGNVIKLSNNRFLNLKDIEKMIFLSVYLGSRFLNVTFRMLFNNLKKSLKFLKN